MFFKTYSLYLRVHNTIIISGSSIYSLHQIVHDIYIISLYHGTWIKQVKFDIMIDNYTVCNSIRSRQKYQIIILLLACLLVISYWVKVRGVGCRHGKPVCQWLNFWFSHNFCKRSNFTWNWINNASLGFSIYHWEWIRIPPPPPNTDLFFATSDSFWSNKSKIYQSWDGKC